MISIHSSFSLLVLTISLTSRAHHCPSSNLNFGSCSNPRIQYGFNIDGSQRYGYAPLDGSQFPHGWSPDIATIESFICNRLESPCNASPDTVSTCREAFNLYSGLSGSWAVDAWNQALGLSPNDDDSCQPEPPGYLTTTTTTLFVPETIVSHPQPSVEISKTTTTTTQTLRTATTSTYTKTYRTRTSTYIVPSPSSTLTITVTLPSSTSRSSSTTNAHALSSTETQTDTQTTVETTTTTTGTTESVVGTSTETTSASAGSSAAGGGGGGGDGSGQGSPFDSESAGSLFPSVLLLGLGAVTLMSAFMV